VLEFTVHNPSDNNFEENLRLVVSNQGDSYSYEMPTSIYSGQKVTYRFRMSDTDIDTRNGYSAIAYYKEVNTDEWIQLTDKTTNIRMPKGTATDGLTIYTVNGSTIKHIAHQDIDGTYASVLSNLPKGVYIVRDKNGTRKVVKRNQ